MKFSVGFTLSLRYAKWSLGSSTVPAMNGSLTHS